MATIRATGSGLRTSHPRGAFCQAALKSEKPGMAFAATVARGPAATVFTRLPRGPRSRARKRDTDSSPALHTPSQSYAVQATRLSKVRLTILPPLPLNGATAQA